MFKQHSFGVLLAALSVLLLVDHASAQSGEKPVRGIVGQRAPEWDVAQWHQLPEGKEDLDIADYRGKVLYLYFFQSWCPGCHSRGFPTLKKLHDKYKDDPNVAFVVIQSTFEGHRINTAEKLAPTARKYDLSIPFGQSAGKGTPPIMRKYRSGGTPWVVLIDKAGQVQFNGFGVEPEKAVAAIERLKSQ